jgi:hypothetical protein
MARTRASGIGLLIAEALLVGSGLWSLEACSSARAVVVDAGHIDQMRLGFALDLEGRVTAGCAASTFSLRDPIHLSMQVNDAMPGSVLSVSVRDVITHRVAWSEQRPVPSGGSYQTVAIGRGIAQGRYRAESTLGSQVAKPWPFVVHDKRGGVR